ncbi:HEAT repeat domain-containing protein [bacterium]|nr:HEAT repeat domain-containing protein [bacterium]
MRLRGMAVFVVLIILLVGAVYLTAYLNQPSYKLTPEELEIERKLALLPIPTSTPVPPSPTPTPVPVYAKTNINELIEILYDKEHLGSGYDRATAARRLGELRANSAIHVLLEMLEDKTWFASQAIRDACMTSLGQIGDPAAIDELTKPMKSGNVLAAQALCMIGTEDAGKELLKYFKSIQNSKQPSNRTMIFALIDILGRLKMKDAINPLMRSIKKRDSEIGTASLGAIRLIGNIKVVLPLFDIYKDSSPMRNEVIKTIEHLLLKDRRSTDTFTDDFSFLKKETWRTHRDHYTAIVIENDELSMFSSIPNDRQELIGNVNIEDDYSLKVKFRRVKGRASADYGIIIGSNEGKRLEFNFNQLTRDNEHSRVLNVLEIKGSKSKQIFRGQEEPVRFGWSELEIRVIDTIVTLYLDGNYLKSLQSTKTDGSFGFYIVGENHVVFDDLIVKSITGPPSIFRTKKDKRNTKSGSNGEYKNSRRDENYLWSKNTKKPSNSQSLSTGELEVEIYVMQRKFNEFIMEVDGKEMLRIPKGKFTIIKKPSVFSTGVYVATHSIKLTSDTHNISCYVVCWESKSKGARCQINIEPRRTKKVYYLSKKGIESLTLK